MRKTKFVATIVIFLLIVMYTINSYAVVSELKIEGEKSIKEGEKVQLKAVYNSYNEDNPNEKIEDNTNVTKKALWLSSDETVATVDENGVVTGISKGIVKITADYEIPAIHELNVLGVNGEEPILVPPEDEENTVVETKTETTNTTVTNYTTTNTTNTTAPSNTKTSRDYLLWFILLLCGILLVALIISAIIKTFKKDDDDDELKL